LLSFSDIDLHAFLVARATNVDGPPWLTGTVVPIVWPAFLDEATAGARGIDVWTWPHFFLQGTEDREVDHEVLDVDLELHDPSLDVAPLSVTGMLGRPALL
jgi:hypothetical protein